MKWGKRERLAKRFVNRRRNLGEEKFPVSGSRHTWPCVCTAVSLLQRGGLFLGLSFFFLLLRLTYVSPDPYLSRDRRKVSRGNFDSSERITFFNYFPDSERRREIYCLFENSLFSVKPKHRSKFERSNRLGSLILKF